VCFSVIFCVFLSVSYKSWLRIIHKKEKERERWGGGRERGGKVEVEIVQRIFKVEDVSSILRKFLFFWEYFLLHAFLAHSAKWGISKDTSKCSPKIPSMMRFFYIAPPYTVWWRYIKKAHHWWNFRWTFWGIFRYTPFSTVSQKCVKQEILSKKQKFPQYRRNIFNFEDTLYNFYLYLSSSLSTPSPPLPLFLFFMNDS
jgi:hypothetical protein